MSDDNKSSSKLLHLACDVRVAHLLYKDAEAAATLAQEASTAALLAKRQANEILAKAITALQMYSCSTNTMELFNDVKA